MLARRWTCIHREIASRTSSLLQGIVHRSRTHPTWDVRGHSILTFLHPRTCRSQLVAETMDLHPPGDRFANKFAPTGIVHRSRTRPRWDLHAAQTRTNPGPKPRTRLYELCMTTVRSCPLPTAFFLLAEPVSRVAATSSFRATGKGSVDASSEQPVQGIYRQ